MSKKMLKRSLVLGALMAFVITGSAMAAELTVDSNVKWDEFRDASGKVRIFGENDSNVEVKDNVVKIVGIVSENTYDNRVYGAYSDTNVASNNKVILENVSGTLGVYGGVGEKGAYNNTLEIILGDGNLNLNGKGSTCSYGGYSTSGNAENNTIIISSEGEGKIVGPNAKNPSNLYGGVSAGGGIAKNNRIEINGGNIDAFTHGGYVNGGIDGGAESNEVVVNDGTITRTIKAGYTKSGYANDNIVTINGGIVKGSESYTNIIYGGEGYTEASRNIVNINGGEIIGDVYGGYQYVPKAGAFSAFKSNDNVVNVNGSTADLDNARLYGAQIVGTGNTLNIGDGWEGTIKSVKRFNNVNIGAGARVSVGEGGMTLPNGATLNLADGNDYINGYAINGKLTTGDKATLTIGNIKETTYNIASAYDSETEWKLVNDLMEVESWNTNGQLQVTVKAQSASDIAENLGVSEGTGNLINGIITADNANKEAVQFVENVMNSGASQEVQKEAYAAMEKMAEAGGQSATAARIVNNVTGVTNDRLSFNCGHSAPHKGGHGVGLFEEGSGADVWVEYVHGKDKVEDMPSTAGASSYEGQFNGIVMGVDFKKVNKFQSGFAFNYGEGDTNSVGSAVRTHSDYDFWGIGYYGNIHNDDSNVIFDISYGKTDSDVTQTGIGGILEAAPETTTWSAGVKVEKLYQNENVQIVPYTGLRFMSINTDDYATKGEGFMYNMERQNIWLLPVGVSIRQEVTNDNGWTVSPRVDLSYIWAFGDTNSNMEVKSPFAGVSQLGYDVMDDGSFLGLVGIEAHKGQWGYGVAYSYQKGDHSESKKWYVDVNYSF